MNLSLKNKNAVVCGSTSGIGKAIAFELANLGASLTLIARDEKRLLKTLNNLSDDESQKHNFIAVDFSDPELLKSKIQEHIFQYPAVHILINNTGGPEAGEITEANISEFKEAFSKHLICNHILVQALLEGMKREKYGRIINIISTSVKQPIKDLGVSNTIRGAVASWAKTLANEVGKFGITVNNVLPGATKTERIYELIKAKALMSGKTEREVSDVIMGEIPAGRFAEPEELAYAAAFLASPSAAYINGISLAVDGGRIACL
jgi:3-oxoacyl-[acyl-carrier protein] reductase